MMFSIRCSAKSSKIQKSQKLKTNQQFGFDPVHCQIFTKWKIQKFKKSLFDPVHCRIIKNSKIRLSINRTPIYLQIRKFTNSQVQKLKMSMLKFCFFEFTNLWFFDFMIVWVCSGSNVEFPLKGPRLQNHWNWIGHFCFCKAQCFKLNEFLRESMILQGSRLQNHWNSFGEVWFCKAQCFKIIEIQNPQNQIHKFKNPKTRFHKFKNSNIEKLKIWKFWVFELLGVLWIECRISTERPKASNPLKFLRGSLLLQGPVL